MSIYQEDYSDAGIDPIFSASVTDSSMFNSAV